MKQSKQQWKHLSNAGVIDTKSLVEDVSEELKDLKEKAGYLLGKNPTLWQQVKNEIVQISDEEEKMEHMRVYAQVTHVEHFLETWVQTAVKDFPTFEFFVMAKAAEIKSGDDKKDYYWALNIRYDQLIALVQVMNLLIKHIERWVELTPENLLQDPVWLGLADYSVEDQIYLEADTVHKNRPHSSMDTA